MPQSGVETTAQRPRGYPQTVGTGVRSQATGLSMVHEHLAPQSLGAGAMGLVCARRLCTTSSVNASRGIDTFSIPRRRLWVRSLTGLVDFGIVCANGLVSGGPHRVTLTKVLGLSVQTGLFFRTVRSLATYHPKEKALGKISDGIGGQWSLYVQMGFFSDSRGRLSLPGYVR